MFLLDTNIVSARRRPDVSQPAALALLESELTFISVITLGEIMKGVEKQRHRDKSFSHALRLWLDDTTGGFANRTIPISANIALAWGVIASGRTRSVEDALIAATAIVHDLTLVTRNTRDFEDLPLKLFNPWAA